MMRKEGTIIRCQLEVYGERFHAELRKERTALGKIIYHIYKVYDYDNPECEEQDGVPRTEHAYNCAFRLKAKVFKMDTVPQIGDRVLLQYRRSKDIEEIWDVSKARIVAIL